MGQTTALLLAFLSVPLALADYSGDYRMTHTGGRRGESRTMEGTIKAKPDAKKMRIDMNMPPMGSISNIVDGATQKAYTIMHSQRTIMEVDSSRFARENNTQCMNVADAAACLTSMGFRKTGTETVNGFSCNVLEKTETRDGGTAVSKIYHPSERKDAPAVRMIMTSPKGNMQMDILNLRFASVAASEFALPTGYTRRDMGALMGTPGADGKAAPDRAALQRMIQEQMAKQGAGAGKRPRSGH